MKKFLFLFIFLIMLCSCEEVHQFSDLWTKNENYHWHDCLTCNETSVKEVHDFDMVVTKKATTKEEGIKTYTCKVCGYSYTDKIDKLAVTSRTLEDDKNDLVSAGYSVNESTGEGNRKCLEASKTGAYMAIYYFENEQDLEEYVLEIKDYLESGYQLSLSSDGKYTEITYFVWKQSLNRLIIASTKEMMDAIEYWNDLPLGHTHTYSDWQYDENNHYKEATCHNDGNKYIEVAHLFEKTSEDENKIVYKCLICGYQKEEKKQNHELNIYTTAGNLSSMLDSIANLYMQKYPGWKVNVIRSSADDIKNNLENGVRPDISFGYSDNVAEYLELTNIVDLSKYINMEYQNINVLNDNEYVQKNVYIGYTSSELADFIPAFYNEGYATNYANYSNYGYNQNSLLTLPFIKSSEVMYYNKSLLDKLHLEVASTWDELWEQAKVIKEYNSSITPFGYDSESNWFITMCMQNNWDYTSIDSPHYLFNNENTISFLEQLKTYYQKGYILTLQVAGGYLSGYFRGEDIIYYVGSSTGASYQNTDNFEWGVTSIPYQNQRKVVLQGPSVYMFENEDKEKEMMSFLFIKELLDTNNMAEAAIYTGYNPSRLSAYQTLKYQEFLNTNSIMAQASKAFMAQFDYLYTTPAFNGSALARTEVGNALVAVLKNNKTAEKALQEALVNCQ